MVGTPSRPKPLRLTQTRGADWTGRRVRAPRAPEPAARGVDLYRAQRPKTPAGRPARMPGERPRTDGAAIGIGPDARGRQLKPRFRTGILNV